MSEDRYEVIAWDGFAYWRVFELERRHPARLVKKIMKLLTSPIFGDPPTSQVKIYDRKLKKFIH